MCLFDKLTYTFENYDGGEICEGELHLAIWSIEPFSNLSSPSISCDEVYMPVVSHVGYVGCRMLNWFGLTIG